MSAFDVPGCREFYSYCLGWDFADAGNGYQVASVNGLEVAGIYEMPEKFQKIIEKRLRRCAINDEERKIKKNLRNL